MHVLLNQAFAQFKLNDTEHAAKSLAAALMIEPDNAYAQTMAARFSFGSTGRAEAEEHFVKIYAVDPKSAPAAYGLCMTAAPEQADEAINWCRKAVGLAPKEKKYTAALERKLTQASKTLEPLILIK